MFYSHTICIYTRLRNWDVIVFFTKKLITSKKGNFVKDIFFTKQQNLNVVVTSVDIVLDYSVRKEQCDIESNMYKTELSTLSSRMNSSASETFPYQGQKHDSCHQILSHSLRILSHVLHTHLVTRPIHWLTFMLY